MHVGRINKGRIYDRGHKRNTTYAHPGSKPGLRNTTGNKGGKGGRIINIGRKRNPRGHIPVGSNVHIRNNGIIEDPILFLGSFIIILSKDQ